MNGLQLSQEYYEAYGGEMLAAFPELARKIAVGIAGSGSECLGYDDELSQDHDFEPGFCIFAFIDEEGDGTDRTLSRREAFQLERAYAKLPKEFRGLKRAAMSPVGGNRRGVVEIADFLQKTTGTTNGSMTRISWLKTPENGLLEAVNGAIWKDEGDLFVPIRRKLAYLPEDVRRKKLAGALLMMAQAGQYNYARLVKRGETGAAQLACVTFAENAIRVAHLLAKRYLPYYKWAFRSLRELDRTANAPAGQYPPEEELSAPAGFYAELANDLEGLLTSPNGGETAESKYFVIEDIAARFIDRLIDEGLTGANCGDLEKHAYSVNDRVDDAELRNMHILSGV
ncbi:MAG: DUF4037 domain-containing protein [Firmicutes bacterium]|nr:DUF4037 domain-containing protein [Bacillota bacterium]